MSIQRSRIVKYTFGTYDDGEPYERHELIRPLSENAIKEIFQYQAADINFNQLIADVRKVEKAHGII